MVLDGSVDFWASTHFLFGATIYLFTSFFGSLTNRVSVYLQGFPGIEYKLTIFFIVVWEVYELVTNPSFWMSTFIYNLMDIVICLIGLKCGIFIEAWIPSGNQDIRDLSD